MVLTALRGAIGFLTRVPIGRDGAAWEAFRRAPVTFPIVGYGIGPLVAVPFLLPITPPTAAAAFLVGLYAVTGINHIDGLGDVGDALAVHGAAERRAVMADTQIGVGAVLLIGLTLAGLALAGLALGGLPGRAAFVVVAAEVGAKLAMAGLACFGSAAHDGLGAAMTSESAPRSFLLPAIVAVPATALTWPNPAALASVLTALGIGLLVRRWSRTGFGGVNGDVMGATNEIARVVALHVGVIVWMRW